VRHNLTAVLTIAYRDFLKFLRDRPRIVSSMAFPLVFVAVLGGSLQSNLGSQAGINFMAFTFTGVLALTLFQSSALGMVSLIDDRESDFSQEMFVAPISRYAIVLGKIAGESLVAMAQGLGIVLLASVIGIRLSPANLVALAPVAVAICLFGGGFGLVVLVNLRSRRGAEQVFPLVILPQFFLAGVFSPVNKLPPLLNVLSHLSPLRYAVDLTRGAFYATSHAYAADYPRIVLVGPVTNLAVLACLFAACLLVGTAQFVRAERNR
jgi:ABC-2 type transport system permease protein